MKMLRANLLKRTYPQLFLEEQPQHADLDLAKKIVGMAHIESPKHPWPHHEVTHDPTISTKHICITSMKVCRYQLDRTKKQFYAGS